MCVEGEGGGVCGVYCVDDVRCFVLTFICWLFFSLLVVPAELFQQKKRAIEDNMQNDHQILNLQQMLELQAVANLANKGKPINAAKKEAEPEQK